ncbi:MAG TPA: hypothetical protein VJC05_04375 [Candidatus Andersenbacteria bacterium]|nr:MAG: hypothetical protein A2854_04735 [Parcubacteria group bacterium RIFCSPHIGHO2_01_FULL_56_18]HLD26249.1 hypothetical protein [Candidatus Andersenbacteria bacterium]
MVVARASIGRRIFDELQRRWRLWHVDVRTRRFIKHNQRIWRRQQQGIGAPQVLINVDALGVNHIRISYVANTLAREHDAVIKSYSAAPLSRQRRLKKVYESFGVTGHILTQLNAGQRQQVRAEFRKTRSRLKTRQNVLDVAVKGVPLGDDIYDTYLREARRGTVHLADPLFDQVLERSIGLVIFWHDYFARYDVTAVAVSFDAYIDIMALVKVAHAYGVPVTNVDLVAPARRGTSTTANAHFAHLHEWFLRLSSSEQRIGLAKGREHLQRRLNGEIGVGISHYMQRSAFHAGRSASVLWPSDRPKILVCTHEFSDAPHCYGEMLFLDFYDWVDWLGRLSRDVDYDWYVKLHPGHWDVSEKIVAGLLIKYPAFTLLPADTSHHQLVEEGISCVLTCMGSVGHEYPALGVPVINAAYNPHVAYSFSHTPKTIDEFRRLILTVPREKQNISLAEIHEFFYMFNYDLLSDSVGLTWWRELMESLAQGESQRPAVYAQFLARYTPAQHEATLRHLAWALAQDVTHPAELTLRRQGVDKSIQECVR